MTAVQKQRWLVAIVGPLAVWAITTAAMTAKSAWAGKETVTAHNADMETWKRVRKETLDSMRFIHTLDSIQQTRILEAVCQLQKPVGVCARNNE